MQRHLETPAHLGRFDPDWVRARERLIAQQRLRSDQEVASAPWWALVFSQTTRITRPGTGQ